ncbi:Rne/Rng family ribonuclease [Paenibacillus sp. Leaf72]|uniref:Rne/Rng family ribonuclease n=1 Tax=Paenibacillus sp. Leaf72 TaxID=1736234 RepID=UPI0006F3542A|nr:Rne/Rng family ribonuclease [Paenibacillus sp. Leaf72]KQO01345.1 ribonuclease [Paenibacillus sp. Leaf72]
MKQMLMHSDGEMLQTAVLQDGRLMEFFMERSEKSGLVGNVYKGRVINVLPGMQAAFVDIGLGKNAFLYIDDLLHPNLEKQPETKPSIEELVRPGQELIVQVMKEPLGGKGARVTTHFTLPGRWLVLMPQAGYVGVSRKIAADSERARLRNVGEQLLQGEEGIILRTAASGETEQSLAADVAQLRANWERIITQAEVAKAPMGLHMEAGLLRRIVRDTLDMEVEEVWIDDASRLQEAAALLREMTPQLEKRLKLYDKNASLALFDAFDVTRQVHEAFQPNIRLASGGSLIWGETEALTVIDVNTGKFTGATNLEDTVFRTNLEAADEIARLLRLRDVGGIIIIDFIDMENESNRERIMARLNEWARRDRTKCSVVGWTRLGLMEVTRKKAREGAAGQLTERCPCCGGSGRKSQA